MSGGALSAPSGNTIPRSQRSAHKAGKVVHLPSVQLRFPSGALSVRRDHHQICPLIPTMFASGGNGPVGVIVEPGDPGFGVPFGGCGRTFDPYV